MLAHCYQHCTKERMRFCRSTVFEIMKKNWDTVPVFDYMSLVVEVSLNVHRGYVEEYDITVLSKKYTFMMRRLLMSYFESDMVVFEDYERIN